MRVVRNTSTGRIVYRESPDFEWGKGIVNAVASDGYTESELEEIEVTEAEWDAELLLREQEQPLPTSQHIGRLIAVDTDLAKPATVRRRRLGVNYDFQCLVAESIKDMWVARKLMVGDYVVVSFIEEIPGTEEKLVAIITNKVFKSW
jgi:hypothetical protein